MMRFGLMRVLDKYAAGALCRLMALVWRLKRLVRPRATADFPPERIKNILVLKFFGAGSLHLAWPMFKGIRRRFPHARIFVLTFESNREFLEVLGVADEILAVRSDRLGHFLGDLLRHWWRLVSHRPDLSFDLEFFSNSSVLMTMFYLARIRVGLYAENAKRGDLLTIRAGFNHYRHVSEVFFRLAEAVGVQKRPELFDLSLPSMAEAYERGVAPRLGLRDGERYAVVNVNSSGLFLHRRWPMEQFAQLIRKLRARHPGTKVVLIGGAGDGQYVGGLHAALADDDGVVNLAGRTSVRELLGLLQHAALLISNDSGPVHFASGCKTPTVAMFGPETPVIYRPLNPNAIVLYAGLYCSPCMNVFANKDFKGCRDNVCMTGISVEQVMEAAESLLDGRAAAEYVCPGRYVPVQSIPVR